MPRNLRFVFLRSTRIYSRRDKSRRPQGGRLAKARSPHRHRSQRRRPFRLPDGRTGPVLTSGDGLACHAHKPDLAHDVGAGLLCGQRRHDGSTGREPVESQPQTNRQAVY